MKLNITVMILKVIKAHQVMATYIPRKNLNNFENLFYYILYLY